ncbi:hypothetical protein BDN71DRAFT_1510830 [Pleurotus eryngii]|uniref:Uncharacterized protein n=1 Tax=Pleurotus eryngii TaxID=5323 RepID=A0A9P5ZMR7_PLEER|nr:hypothetical protein BDN71DRAFT_1510830 [Pleurotus eryngii]
MSTASALLAIEGSTPIGEVIEAPTRPNADTVSSIRHAFTSSLEALHDCSKYLDEMASYWDSHLPIPDITARCDGATVSAVGAFKTLVEGSHPSNPENKYGASAPAPASQEPRPSSLVSPQQTSAEK